MAVSYILGSNPIWYFVDLVGKPLGAGYFATYDATNPSQLKAVFEDPDGIFPFPYVDIPNTDLKGILIDENGTLGPIYFADDAPYLLTWFDRFGVQIDQVDNFTPGTGGGGNVTEALNLTNLVVNGVFWRGEINAPVSGATDVFLCPGAHAGFCNSLTPNNQPDIRFIKSNTAATDTLTFIPFTQGSSALAGDVTPPVYLRYSCTAIGGGGETFKFVQFPLSIDIQSTSGQPITTTLWARTQGGATDITIQYRQFFGDGGGASSPVLSTGQTVTLTANWQKIQYTETLPSIAGKTLGACQNTAIYLQVQYPLSATTIIDMVKPCSYLTDNLAPTLEYLTNDQIDAVINAPRVGDVRVALNAFSPYGWVICNDGTIGNPSSGATRANFDTFPLFDCIWNNVSNANAPLLESTGMPVGARGASSTADYALNRQLTLTKTLGRALSSAGQPSSGGSGNTWAVGLAQGEENHTLTIGEMPSHNHPGSFIGGSSSQNVGAFVQRSDTNNANQALTIAAQGGGGGHNTIQPTAYFNVFLKL